MSSRSTAFAAYNCRRVIVVFEYSQRNCRHQVVGHLFQGRFKSTVIEAEKYLLEVSRYLHLNPVRGMVLGQGTPSERRERLREYRWSSYRAGPGTGE
jgi:putative transposase